MISRKASSHCRSRITSIRAGLPNKFSREKTMRNNYFNATNPVLDHDPTHKEWAEQVMSQVMPARISQLCVTEAHRTLPTTGRPQSGVLQGDLSIPSHSPDFSPMLFVHFLLAQLKKWLEVGSSQVMDNWSINSHIDIISSPWEIFEHRDTWAQKKKSTKI